MEEKEYKLLEKIAGLEKSNIVLSKYLAKLLVEIENWKDATGYEDSEDLDCVLGRAGVDTHIRVLTEMREGALKMVHNLELQVQELVDKVAKLTK